MTLSYHQQREWIISKNPAFERDLPLEEPAPRPLAPMTLPQARKILAEPANNHAEILFVIGWGDGQVLRWIASDARLRQKKIFNVLLKGEEQDFAASFAGSSSLLESLDGLNFTIFRMGDEREANTLCFEQFNHHHMITPLAGCDIIDTHPLSVEGEKVRTILGPIFTKTLSDRPPMYGNDIEDSFNGLINCAKNAKTVLTVPSIEDCRGHFGPQIPVISIAGGPSLARHLPRLRELQDRCILVACDSVLKGLLSEGIEPHFVTPLERIPETIPLSLPVKGTKCIFAGSPVVPADTLLPYDGRAIGIFAGDQVYTWLDEEIKFRINTGSSAGVLSFMVASGLSQGPVWLLGHDLARSGEQSHWNGAEFSVDAWKIMRKMVEEGQRSSTGYEDRLVPGNNGQEVPSIAWWDRFRNEIAAHAGYLGINGRTVFNVNAMDGIGARIDNTQAAYLPDPATLQPLGPMNLPVGNPARYENWRKRAALLGEDTEGFIKHLRSVRDEIASARLLAPDQWPLETLGARIDIFKHVSHGNRWAFYYFLRSALHNTTAEMHMRRRTNSLARYRWIVLDAMDGLCHSLDNALVRLGPKLQEIANENL